MSQYVEILNMDSDYQPDPEVITFPFECDNFQKHSFESIHERKNILVTVPTSSGKTTVAEYAIVYNIKKMGKKVVYTSPIKSLSNEKYNDFKARFEKYNISVGLLTGDWKIDVNSDCLIVTAEILRNSLYKLKNKIENPESSINDDFVNSIGCVIMDEVHYMADEDRGRTWEETIILLDNSVQLIMLSATISNAYEFAKWIGQSKQKTISLIQADKRIIPLEHHLFVNNKLHTILTSENKYNSEIFNAAKKEHFKRQEKRKSKGLDIELLHGCVNYLQKHNLFQSIFFSFSKGNCEKYAHSISTALVDHNERKHIVDIFNSRLSPYFSKYEFDSQFLDLKELLPRGIAYHHSGLWPIFKEIVEILFKEGYIKVLFATETFAVGVNMPARSVIFTEMSKFTEGGKRSLNTAEYKQMSGRAGRRGLDTLGTVIILPIHNLLDESDFKTIALGMVPGIDSKFKWDYQFYLKVIQSDITSIDSFFEKSLINVNNKSQLDYELQQEEKLINQITELETKMTLYTENMKDVKRLIQIEQQSTKTDSFVKLSKGQQKEYDLLKMSIEKNNNTFNAYKLYKQITDLTKKLHIVQQTIVNYKNFVGQSSNDISKILHHWGYLENNIPTIKGVIAAQINDCNSILLTELIYRNYFDDLTPQEIVALISIFCEPIKITTIEESEYYEGTDAIFNCVTSLDKLIEEYKESEYQISRIQSDWKYTLSYIDIALAWAHGIDQNEMLKMLYDFGEYGGNFLRNMLRIYNIINNLKCICKSINKHNILPQLEQIDGLILRDIVTINSLYLGI